MTGGTSNDPSTAVMVTGAAFRPRRQQVVARQRSDLEVRFFRQSLSSAVVQLRRHFTVADLSFRSSHVPGSGHV